MVAELLCTKTYKNKDWGTKETSWGTNLIILEKHSINKKLCHGKGGQCT